MKKNNKKNNNTRTTKWENSVIGNSIRFVKHFTYTRHISKYKKKGKTVKEKTFLFSKNFKYFSLIPQIR